MIRVSGWMASSTPSSPRYRPVTAPAEGSMLITTSAPATAAAGSAATATPSASTVLSSSGTRSKAVTVWPALTRLAAIGPPMLPTPKNPMFILFSFLNRAL